MDALADNIADLEAVGNVDTQVVIYSDYTVNDQDSDSEGQLIPHGRRIDGINSLKMSCPGTREIYRKSGRERFMSPLP